MTAEETVVLLDAVRENFPDFGEIMLRHKLDARVMAELVHRAAGIPLSRPGPEGRMMRVAAHVALGYQLAKELEALAEGQHG